MSLKEYAESHGLKRVGARPPLGEYLVETWRRRGFAYTLSKFTNEAQDANTRLGRGWVILQPTLQAATYGLIFGVILGSKNRPENFLSFLFIGVFFYNYMLQCFQYGATSITSNSGLVNSLSFPRALLPLSAAIRSTLNLWAPLVILAVLLPITGSFPHWRWLLLLPIMALMAVFSAGLSLIGARLNAEWRDLNNFIPFITRVGFYMSGVFFSLQKVLAEYPLAKQIFSLNPFYDFIQLSRCVLLPTYFNQPQRELWIMAISWSVVIPIVGILYFWKAEEKYGRE